MLSSCVRYINMNQTQCVIFFFHFFHGRVSFNIYKNYHHNLLVTADSRTRLLQTCFSSKADLSPTGRRDQNKNSKDFSVKCSVNVMFILESSLHQ